MILYYKIVLFFLKNHHHYSLDSLYWLIVLDKYAGESLGDRNAVESLHHSFFQTGLLLRGIEPQYRRSEINNNSLSHFNP